MRKLSYILCCIMLFGSLLGCQEVKSKQILPTEVTAEVFMCNGAYDGLDYVIPFLTNDRYKSFIVKRLNGTNVDDLGWECSYWDPIPVQGVYANIVKMRITNVTKPVDIESAVIEADGKELTAKFGKFHVDASSADTLALLNQLIDWGVGYNHGEESSGFSFVSKKDYVVDGVEFSDFYEITDYLLRFGIEDEDIIPISLSDYKVKAKKEFWIEMPIKLRSALYANRVLYFNIILKYHWPGENAERRFDLIQRVNFKTIEDVIAICQSYVSEITNNPVPTSTPTPIRSEQTEIPLSSSGEDSIKFNEDNFMDIFQIGMNRDRVVFFLNSRGVRVICSSMLEDDDSKPCGWQVITDTVHFYFDTRNHLESISVFSGNQNWETAKGLKPEESQERMLQLYGQADETIVDSNWATYYYHRKGYTFMMDFYLNKLVYWAIER